MTERIRNLHSDPDPGGLTTRRICGDPDPHQCSKVTVCIQQNIYLVKLCNKLGIALTLLSEQVVFLLLKAVYKKEVSVT